jgi:formylglycine-generating enzyme required for sulfatase activity
VSQKPDDVKFLATPSLLGACGRADLLYALAAVQENTAQEITGREIALAEIFGFFPNPEKQKSDDETVKKPEPTPPIIDILTTETTELTNVFRPYRLVAVETVQSNEAWQVKPQDIKESGNLTHADMEAWDAFSPLPKALPIVPWTRLWPRLRQAVACRHAAGIDFKRLSDCMARGIAIRQLPRLSRLAWPNPLTVVLDFSDRLTPYWEDWHWLREHLQSRLHQQVRFFRLHGVSQRPLQPIFNGKPDTQFTDWPKLNAGSVLLLVSDLGMVDAAHPWPGACWQSKLNDYRSQGVHIVVLAPVSARHLQPSLVNAAQTVRLSPDSTLRPIPRLRTVTEDSCLSKNEDYAGCKTLLAMLSVATRVEAALLRDLRRCLPDDGHDAGLEGEVWCHKHLDTSAIACAVSPYAVNEWRDEFRKLDAALQQRTLACLRDWHARLPQAIHHEETLVWRWLAQYPADAVENTHVKRARAFFERVTNSLQEKEKASLNPVAYALQIQLADRHLQWVSPILATTEAYIAQLSVAIDQADPERSASGLPDGMDPIAWLQAWPVQSPQKLKLIQQADCHLSLSADFTPETAASGVSPLADLELDVPVVLWAWDVEGQFLNYRPWHWQTTPQDNAPLLPELLSLSDESVKPTPTLCIHTGQQQMRFERLATPSWATGMGQDNYGLYADLELNGIIQRFRWINPGTFTMGSPTNEPERSDSELQHKVTLTHGYWLADSACTQALWLAVTGGNPSRFQENTNNPVENVSWDDVQAFIQRLNQSRPGLLARLPSEAEWEYACRAGTTTPFSFGDNITTEQVNYNGDYPYAGAAKGEYRKKTVAVKSLSANPWGLYEMHGNVWEWCADWFGEYEQAAVIDPPGPTEGSYRVLRGGSWYVRARITRSAYRSRSDSDGRYDLNGFRLALGRAGVSPARWAGTL